MARKFIDGFENGNSPPDLWDTENNATVVSSAGLDMDGDYCLDVKASGEYIQKSITADDEMYVAFLYRHTSISYDKTALTFLHNSTVLGTLKVLSAAGLIACYSSTNTLKDTGNIGLSVNTTYLIEIFYKIADAGGRWIVKINSVQDIDFTGDTKPGAETQFDQIRFGGTNSYAYFDNVILDDANWVGDTKIQGLVPTGAGNTTGWTPSVGANWECVDEKPASDADYVEINAIDTTDTYATGNLAGTIGNIKCVQVQSRVAAEGSPVPTNLKLVNRVNVTDYLSGDKAIPSTAKSLWNLWENNPDDAAAWEAADVNGMEIGTKSAA